MFSQVDAPLILFEHLLKYKVQNIPQPLHDHQCNTLIFSKLSTALPQSAWPKKWTSGCPDTTHEFRHCVDGKTRVVYGNLFLCRSLQPPRHLIQQIVSLDRAITLKLYSGRHKEYMTTAGTVTQQPWSTSRDTKAVFLHCCWTLDTVLLCSLICTLQLRPDSSSTFLVPGHPRWVLAVTWTQPAYFYTFCVSESCWHYATIQGSFPTWDGNDAQC